MPSTKRLRAPEKVPADSVQFVFKTLDTLYPGAETELSYENPFQLLIAVILSAQCTDERVNRVTPHLFGKYPDAPALSQAKPEDVEKIIHSCGFFRQKTKSIINTAKDLVERFGGAIPRTLEELTTLRGVGRKTASVVLNQAFDLPAIAVDTHVKRVSHRLGWTKNTDPEKVEFDLRDLVPETQWASINSLLIFHGRRLCHARAPKCSECPVKGHCAHYKLLPKKK